MYHAHDAAGPDFSPLHFAPSASRMHLRDTGKMHDGESNLDDFRTRYYTSTMGRWMTPDWSARGEAVPYATLTNPPRNQNRGGPTKSVPFSPQSLNLYAYVLDNPTTLTDPDGHAAWPGEIASFFRDLACSLTKSCNGQSSQVAANQTNANSPAAQQKNTDTVTVEEVKGQGVNGGPLGFSHAAISVDGKQPVGLEQKKKDCGTCAVEDRTTPGAVKPVDPKRTVLAKVTIHITHAQAGRIQTFLNRASKSPPNYNLYHSNCAEFCEAGLRAGGLKAPNDVTPGGLIDDLRKLYPQQ